MKGIYVMWSLHLILVPIYVFGSGKPQPSHMFLLATLIAFSVMRATNTLTVNLAVSATLRQASSSILLIFSLFAAYVCLVNAYWMVALSSYKPLMFASFQVYNLLLIYFVLALAVRDFRLFVRYTHIGFSAALMLIILAILVSGIDSATRESGLFNNPNQLAFFALSASLIFYMSEKLGVGTTIWNRAMMGLACFICALSLSRAGLAGCALILGASFLDGKQWLKNMVLMTIVTGALLAFAGASGITERMSARSEQTNAVFENQFVGRGYDRMLVNPEYLFFGAGEGDFKRFGGILASMGAEMHSSMGTLLFSYGFIGLLLYSMIWKKMLSANAGVAYKLCAMAPIAYGVTHNGLRFSAAIIAMMFMICGGLVLSQRARAEITQ